MRRLAAWLWRRLRAAWRAAAPGPAAWRGAAWGMSLAGGLLLLYSSVAAFGSYSWWALPAAVAGGTLAALLVALLTVGLLRWLARWPVSLTAGAAAGVTLLLLAFLNSRDVIVAVVLPTVLIPAGLAGAGLSVLRRGGWRRETTGRRILTLLGLIVGLGGLGAAAAWFWWPGSVPPPPVNAARYTADPTASLPDPTTPGPYGVRTLRYGSGTDNRRPEWGAGVDLVTTPVNGNPFLSGWTDLRTRYWGFDERALPRNGRVWYPDGAGPFPLVLIVHGNHEMSAYSDAGYAYLAELLASRGLIVASIDQNFLNGSSAADWLGERRLRGENDARAWLLLEHLRLWREWERTAGTPFYRQVDLTRIGLIGHSRGGEAVAVAAAFNRLDRYPDNARIPFSYDFGIRAVMAIAPVDGQYRPAGAPTPLHNVSYLVLQGAHDMDVTTFMGQQQYNRTTFDRQSEGFKASVYVYGANHGQFNTDWGRADRRAPTSRFYNLAQLLPAAAQQRIAQAYAVAFMAATLQEADGYRLLFQDARAGDWLPETIYLTRYADGRVRYVATFEEDVDVLTATAPGGQLLGRSLSSWREARLPQKREDLDSRAVLLGWRGRGNPATYAVTLPPDVRPEAGGQLLFALADAETDDGEVPIDLSIELADGAGETAVLPLSYVMPLQPQLVARLTKPAPWDDAPASEPVLQSFALPLDAFAATNPALDVGGVTTVTFRFDRTLAGKVWLDDVGFRP